MSSLDGSMKIYPVQMTPLDWFEGLSTSFTMEDLTQDPEIIRTQINAKSQQLDVLNSQLVALQMGAKGDPSDLRTKVQDAQRSLDNAQSALATDYSSNVISMANTFLTAAGTVDLGALATELGLAGDVATAFLKNLPDEMQKVQQAQDALTQSSRALSQMMAAQALAEATDTRQQQQQLTLQIQSLTGELKELQTRWQVLTAKTGGVNVPGPVNVSDLDVPAIQLPAENTSGGSRWQTISITSNQQTRAEIASENSDATVRIFIIFIFVQFGNTYVNHRISSRSNGPATCGSHLAREVLPPRRPSRPPHPPQRTTPSISHSGQPSLPLIVAGGSSPNSSRNRTLSTM